MNKYHELKTITLNNLDKITQPPEFNDYQLSSPAITVVTDFMRTEPLSMEQDVSIDDAQQMMRKMHVRSVLVINSEGSFRGLLSLADLESRKALSVATNMGVTRKELTIRDVMTPRDKLKGVSLTSVEQSQIGDLLETLRHEGSQHMLVVDASKQQLRGVISSSDIARKLKVSVDISQKATNFRDIVSVIYAGQDT